MTPILPRKRERDLLAAALVAVAAVALVWGNAASLARSWSLLFQPLPYDRPDRLMVILGSNPMGGSISSRAFLAWRDSARHLRGLAAFKWDRYFVSSDLGLGGKSAQDVLGALVSPTFFDVLGVKPALGRTFRPEEEEPGMNRVVILGHRYWRDRFGSDRNVLGRQIVIDGEKYTVEGVLPESMWFFSSDVAVWMPLVHQFDLPGRPKLRFDCIARIRHGVTPARAEFELKEIIYGRKIWVASYGRVRPLRDELVRDLLIPVPLLALALLVTGFRAAYETVRAVRHEREHWKYEARFWGLLLGKVLIVCVVMAVAWAPLAEPSRQLAGSVRGKYGLMLLLWFWLLAGLALVYGAYRDQRYRCRVCLRHLRMPVPTGSYSAPLLALPPGYEYICPFGHGKLSVRAFGLRDAEEPQWTYYGDFWAELIHADDESKQSPDSN